MVNLPREAKEYLEDRAAKLRARELKPRLCPGELIAGFEGWVKKADREKLVLAIDALCNGSCN
jgi:hypothetical protein